MTTDLLLSLLPDHRASLEALARRHGVSAEQVAEALLSWLLQRLDPSIERVRPQEIEEFIDGYCHRAAEACLGEDDLKI